MLLPGALGGRCQSLLLSSWPSGGTRLRCLRSLFSTRAVHGHAVPSPLRTPPLQKPSEHSFLSRRVPPGPFCGQQQQTRGAKTHSSNKSKQSKRSQEEEWKARNRTVLTYIAAAGVGMLGLSYAAVPLYRLYCQAAGLGGAAVAGHDSEQVEHMTPVKERVIKITFNADTHASMQWNFRPQQTEIYVVPGETALAFYRAKNPTDRPVIGISTYNVVPFDAGQYFNKIQCFCFEEQRLNPQEEVDMPVFFYIDPEFDLDPRMARVDTITLSYTFFEAKEGQTLPLPGYS